ncbi:MAG: hypothetical protein HY078_12765 [Elusimicrobia bacterium]|nr:hypothetical protein [Elusimicrobiota bacterium]
MHRKNSLWLGIVVMAILASQGSAETLADLNQKQAAGTFESLNELTQLAAPSGAIPAPAVALRDPKARVARINPAPVREPQPQIARTEPSPVVAGLKEPAPQIARSEPSPVVAGVSPPIQVAGLKDGGI